MLICKAPVYLFTWCRRHRRDQWQTAAGIWLARVILTAIIGPCAVGSAQSLPSPGPFHAQLLVDDQLRYRTVSGHNVFGETLVTIVHDRAAGVIHISEATRGLFARTTAFTLRADSTLQPLTSHTIVSDEDWTREAHLRYEDRTVNGMVKRPEALGGNLNIHRLLSSGVADVNAVPYLLRASRLAVGRTLTFPIFDALENEETLARAWVVRTEEVSVPAGSFHCYRVEGFSGKARWILLLESTAPHRLIKQILPAAHLSFELVEVSATF
ncbi:MAG: DUF3108 domain-containing protein [candidate division KSB1 bacterium]|nr:DUF3108 domain-containing protein [candidate division KSB1 bacterium]MDZ7273368.1 DUF3108 domain-containing protein [candidate division KSB1 bacterium]MDZ7288030.1 DUF3108 domain-containing protein [candidate division KSB1 bacterium]MDZ7300118.1 DUF3108 domain-containing protein [candidate division KSB1 bacterium]MDZ7308890.1 DUF3108 domain-containing protein [candidate division KSB1 bacterium]